MGGVTHSGAVLQSWQHWALRPGHAAGLPGGRSAGCGTTNRPVGVPLRQGGWIECLASRRCTPGASPSRSLSPRRHGRASQSCWLPGGLYPDCMRDGAVSLRGSLRYFRPKCDRRRGWRDASGLRATVCSARHKVILETVPEGEARHCIPCAVGLQDFIYLLVGSIISVNGLAWGTLALSYSQARSAGDLNTRH